MQQQFDNIHQAFGSDVKVTIVVGYKLEHIIEAFPQASFVYNEQYDQTNTSKSLLRALQASKDGGVLWMNGDVVFDPEALVRAGDLVARDRQLRHASTPRRCPTRRSSTRPTPRASSASSPRRCAAASARRSASTSCRAATRRRWCASCTRVADQDYFERGIELAIEQDKLRFEPVDISDLYAVEIDFAEDLERANLFV